MSGFLVTITQDILGKTFETIHGVIIGDNDAGLLEADVALALGVKPGSELPNLNDNDVTDPSVNPDYDRSFGIVGAIIWFHRYMQAPAVTLKQVSFSDNKKQTDAFYTIPIDLPCVGQLRGTAYNDPAELAALNHTIEITKRPLGVGNHSGRMYLRAALAKTDVNVASGDGVTFATGIGAIVRAGLLDALSTSDLPDYFSTINPPTLTELYGIPEYYPNSSSNAGQLLRVNPCSGFAVRDVTDRNTRRRSKRS